MRSFLGGLQFSIPLLELIVGHPVGETFAADTDSLKHTVATKLMQNEAGVDHSYKSKERINKTEMTLNEK